VFFISFLFLLSFLRGASNPIESLSLDDIFYLRTYMWQNCTSIAALFFGIEKMLLALYM
jgi:hypothetical protein